jgi:hypothetical protein
MSILTNEIKKLKANKTNSNSIFNYNFATKYIPHESNRN